MGPRDICIGSLHRLTIPGNQGSENQLCVLSSYHDVDNQFLDKITLAEATASYAIDP